MVYFVHVKVGMLAMFDSLENVFRYFVFEEAQTVRKLRLQEVTWCVFAQPVSTRPQCYSSGLPLPRAQKRIVTPPDCWGRERVFHLENSLRV